MRRHPQPAARPADGLPAHRRGTAGEVYSGAGPAWSQQLDAWLLVVPEGYSVRLRLSEDEAGTRIVPTTEESAEAAQRALALQKAAFEAEKSAREAEKAALKRALDQQKAAREAEKAAFEAEMAALDRAFEAEMAALKAEKAMHEHEVGPPKAQLREAEAKAAPRRPRRKRTARPGP